MGGHFKVWLKDQSVFKYKNIGFDKYLDLIMQMNEGLNILNVILSTIYYNGMSSFYPKMKTN